MKKESNKFIDRHLFSALSFVFPFFSILALLFLFGIAPFGDYPRLLTGDADYFYYLNGLHRFIVGDGFFSATDLATNADLFHARYLGSPFTWLNALAPSSLQETTYFLLLALKSACASLVFSLFLSKRRPQLKPLFRFLLSFLYALPVVLSLTDGLALLPEQLILLPLLLLSLESFLERGQFVLLSVILTFVFLTGFSFAYVLIPLSLLALFLSSRGGHVKRHPSLKFSYFLTRSLFSLFAACLVASPLVFISFQNFGDLDLFSTYAGAPLYRLPFLLLGFWTGVRVPTYPIFYIGLLPLLLLPLFFFCKSISRCYRIAFAITLTALVTLFFFFNPMNGALSFCLSFLVLLPCVDLLSTKEKMRPLPLMIATVFFLLFPLLLEKANLLLRGKSGDVAVISSIFGVYIPLIFISLMTLILSGMIQREKKVRIFAFFLVLLSLFDGTLSVFHRIAGKEFLASEEETKVVSISETTDLLFERAELERELLSRTRYHADMSNISLPYHEDWISDKENATLYSHDIQGLFASLGYGNTASPLFVPDALLGISYVLSNQSLSSANYTSLSEKDGLTLFDSNALPLVFTASSTVLTLNETVLSPFAYTNAFFTAMRGEKTDIYRPIDTVMKKENDVAIYQGTMTDSGEVYFHFKPESEKSYRITSDEKNYQVDGTNGGIVPLGRKYVKATVSFTVEPPYTILFTKDADFLWMADEQALHDAIADLTQGALKEPKISGNKISGTFTSTEDEVLMTTLPFDADYTVRIDGAIAETHNVDGLLAVTVAESGDHTVTFYRSTSLGFSYFFIFPIALGLVFIVLSVVKSRISKPDGKETKH